MLYNKNQFTKTKDKKVLHKVGKHWVTISLATLMALGGLSMAKDVSAHADTDATNGSNVSNTNAIKERLNSNLKQTSSQNQSAQANAQKGAQSSSQSINNQANALHNRILANAALTQKQSNGTGQGRITNGSQTSAKNVSTSSASNADALHNRIASQTSSVGQTSVAPNPMVGEMGDSASENFSDVPVTVKYINKNGSVQKDINGNDRVSEADVRLSGNVGSSASYSFSAPASYSIANVGSQIDAIMIRGSYSWLSGANAIDDNYSSDDSASVKQGAKFANWDPANNRPLVLLAPNATAAADMKIQYMNQSGHIVHSDDLNGESTDANGVKLSDEVGNYISVWQDPSNWRTGSNPSSDAGDYQIVNNATKDKYPVSSQNQTITVPVQGKTNTGQSDDNNKVSVTFNLYDHDDRDQGKQGVTAGTPAHTYHADAHLVGTVGDNYPLTPSDFKGTGTFNSISDGSGHHISSDLKNYHGDQTGTEFYLKGTNADGGNARAVLSNHNITFNYYANSNYNTNVSPININYVNQNGKNVGSRTITPTSSDYGKTVQVNNSDATIKSQLGNGVITSENGVPSAGESVPSGYSINPGQELNYKVISGGDGQNVTINVTGNYVSQNLTVNETNNYSPNGVSNFGGSGQPATPTLPTSRTVQVSGRVGDQVKISAAKYAPVPGNNTDHIGNASGDASKTASDDGLKNSDTVIPTNVVSDTYTIGQSGLQNANDSEAASAPSFTYDIYSHTGRQASESYTNTISYVSYSDIRNNKHEFQSLNPSDAIDWMGNHGKFLTTKVVANNGGKSFNDQTYRENVPKGYQFYRVLKVNDKTPSTDPTAVKQGLTNFGGNDSSNYKNQNEVIEVIPNAGNVTINYIDQNGKKIKSNTFNGIVQPGASQTAINGTSILNSDVSSTLSNSNAHVNGYNQSDESDYTTNFGKVIPTNAIDQTVTSNTDLGVPTGYEISKSQSGNYSQFYNGVNDTGVNYDDDNVEGAGNNGNVSGVPFTRDNQTINVMVAGKQLPIPKNNSNASSDQKKQSIENNTAHINIVELSPSDQEQNSYTLSDVLNGRVGDSFDIDGSKFAPGNYSLYTGSDVAPGSQTSRTDADGNGSVTTKDGYETNVDGVFGAAGISPSSATFYFKQDVDRNYQDLTKPVVYFQNVSDGNIVDTETLDPKSGDYSGETTNISDNDQFSDANPTTGGIDGSKLVGYSNPVKGYQLAANQNMNTVLSVNPQNPIYIQVYNPTHEYSGIFNINKDLYKNGTKVNTLYSDAGETGSVGATTTVNASDYNNVDGYSMAASNTNPDDDNTGNVASGDSNVQVSFGSSNMTPSSVDWTYLAENTRNDANGGSSAGTKPTDPSHPSVGPDTHIAEPIYVQYKDASNNQLLGYNSGSSKWSDTTGNNGDIRIDGTMGDVFSDINKTAVANATSNGDTTSTPSDVFTMGGNQYHLVGRPSLVRQITTHQQQVVLPVAQTKAGDQSQKVEVTTGTPSDYTSGSNLKTISDNFTVSDNESAPVNPDMYRPAGDINVPTGTANSNPSANRAYDIINQNGTLQNYSDSTYQNDPSPIHYYFETNVNNNVNAQPLTVHYFNELGQELTLPNPSKAVVRGSLGQNFTVPQIMGQTGHPDGYTNVIPSEEGENFKISNEPQSINLVLQGASANDKLSNYKIKVTAYNSDGTPTINDQSDALKSGTTVNYGGTFNVDPNDYNPDASKYNLMNGDHSWTVHLFGNPSNYNFDPATNTIHFYYQATKSLPSNTAWPLTVKYVDQNSGQQVGSDFEIANKHEGTYISDVTSPADGGQSVPSGYSLTSGQDKSFTFPNDQTQDPQDNKVLYVVGSDIPTSPVNDQYNMTINRILVDLHGHVTRSNETVNMANIPGGPHHIGDNVTVSANDFVPLGYKVAPGDPNAVIHINNNSLTPNYAVFTYDQEANTHAGWIKVNYINQNGQHVQSNGQLTGDNGADSDGYTLPDSPQSDLAGQWINVTDPNDVIKDGSTPVNSGHDHGYSVPTGYTLDKGQNTNYMFESDNQTADLLVSGNPVKPSDNTNHHKVGPSNPSSDNKVKNHTNSDNQLAVNIYKNGQYSGTRYMYINNALQPGLRVGDIYNVDAGQFTPQGYYVDPNGYNNADGLFDKSITPRSSDQYGTGEASNAAITDQGQQIVINPQGGIDPTVVNFNYDSFKNQAAPITLKYIDQAGNQVGYTDYIYGNVGSDINVEDPSDGGEQGPKGYTINGNTYNDSKTSSDYDAYQHLTGHTQDPSYTLGHDPKTVYLQVTGNQVSNGFTIEEVERHNNGDGTYNTVGIHNVTTSDNSTLRNKLTGKRGDSVEISPDDFIPNGYTPDYSSGHDSDQPVTLGNDQPNKVAFYYDDDANTGAPITIRFVDQNGHQIGYNYTPKSGNIGTQTSDASDLFNAAKNNGDSALKYYSFDTNAGDIASKGFTAKNTKYSYTASPQTETIKLQGQQITRTFRIHQILENASGSDGKVSAVIPVTVTGNVGDKVTFSPYSFGLGSDRTSISGNTNDSTAKYTVPTGYHATNSDSDVVDTIEPGMSDGSGNAEGALSPLSDVNFVYEQSSVAPTYGHIVVHYITNNLSAPSDGQSVPAIAGLSGTYHEVDQESDNGIVGDSTHDANTMNLTPYDHDIPETLKGFFDTTKAAGKSSSMLDSNGNSISIDPNNTPEAFQANSNNNTRDFYVTVTPSGAPIWID